MSAGAGVGGGMDWIDEALAVEDRRGGGAGGGETEGPTAEEIAAKEREEVRDGFVSRSVVCSKVLVLFVGVNFVFQEWSL